MDQHPTQGDLEILVVASCYRNRDKLQLYVLLADRYLPSRPALPIIYLQHK